MAGVSFNSCVLVWGVELWLVNSISWYTHDLNTLEHPHLQFCKTRQGGKTLLLYCTSLYNFVFRVRNDLFRCRHDAKMYTMETICILIFFNVGKSFFFFFGFKTYIGDLCYFHFHFLMDILKWEHFLEL